MKWKQEIKRKIIQIAAFGFSNSYIGNTVSGKLYTGKWKNFCNPGMNCYSCPAARMSCPIGAMQAVDGAINFDFSFYVLGFVLALGVLFGRAICGFICPFGLIQELIYKIPSPKRTIWKGLRYLKYIILAVFVFFIPIFATNYLGMGEPAFCQYICPVGTLEGGILITLTHSELWQMLGGLFFLKIVILIITLIGCLVVNRFFCKVMCPLGAIYGLLNKISIYHMEVNKDQCVKCGKCKNICPMEVDPVKTPNSAECIRCGKCVANCSQKALYLGVRGVKKKQEEKSTDVIVK